MKYRFVILTSPNTNTPPMDSCSQCSPAVASGSGCVERVKRPITWTTCMDSTEASGPRSSCTAASSGGLALCRVPSSPVSGGDRVLWRVPSSPVSGGDRVLWREPQSPLERHKSTVQGGTTHTHTHTHSLPAGFLTTLHTTCGRKRLGWWPTVDCLFFICIHITDFMLN